MAASAVSRQFRALPEEFLLLGGWRRRCRTRGQHCETGAIRWRDGARSMLSDVLVRLPSTIADVRESGGKSKGSGETAGGASRQEGLKM